MKGPATAGPGVTGKLGTIKRSDGSIQATYNGHPLYTYVADTAPGQARGNGLNVNGGLWHEVTASGADAPPKASASSAGGKRVLTSGEDIDAVMDRTRPARTFIRRSQRRRAARGRSRAAGRDRRESTLTCT